MNMVNATQETNSAGNVAAAPAKWAALVADTLVPLPRRLLKARDILFQSQAPAGTVLIRDLNSPIDVAFSDNADVDLAGGNVFRLGRDCDIHDQGARGGKPKLAFVVNDAWAVTTDPNQTAQSLRGLFDLGEEVEFLRDLESPNDEPIGETEQINFADGPVFLTRRGLINVEVNTKPVVFTKRRVTGLGIKKTAIEQNVSIKTDFVLYRELPDGGLSAAIGNEQYVTLHECEKFTCVAPDDNS
jgi:hypothetical protein